jgi:hypothetical protein
MIEFDTIKAMLERIDHEIEITVWDIVDQSYIIDNDAHIEFWFKGGKLQSIYNNMPDDE